MGFAQETCVIRSMTPCRKWWSCLPVSVWVYAQVQSLAISTTAQIHNNCWQPWMKKSKELQAIYIWASGIDSGGKTDHPDSADYIVLLTNRKDNWQGCFPSTVHDLASHTHVETDVPSSVSLTLVTYFCVPKIPRPSREYWEMLSNYYLSEDEVAFYPCACSCEASYRAQRKWRWPHVCKNSFGGQWLAWVQRSHYKAKQFLFEEAVGGNSLTGELIYAIAAWHYCKL